MPFIENYGNLSKGLDARAKGVMDLEKQYHDDYMKEYKRGEKPKLRAKYGFKQDYKKARH